MIESVIWLHGQPVHLGQPHNIGDDVEQSDWAVLLAAAVQLIGVGRCYTCRLWG